MPGMFAWELAGTGSWKSTKKRMWRAFFAREARVMGSRGNAGRTGHGITSRRNLCRRVGGGSVRASAGRGGPRGAIDMPLSGAGGTDGDRVEEEFLERPLGVGDPFQFRSMPREDCFDLGDGVPRNGGSSELSLPLGF